ncbi:MAG TPA: class II aldolase/adducin family protein [Actinomycetes bacterium]|nr:class II aldolase/adducin family protein [Actinomycetes bacterium]
MTAGAGETVLLAAERQQVADYCRRMRADRLVVGTSGNLSARSGDLVAVSPSGLDYDELTAALVGVHRADSGAPVEAPRGPTTELPMHLAIYRHTGAGAIVHTHSTAATAVSTLVDELPPIHYLIAMFGGGVRVAGYATYGSDELAGQVSAALAGRTGCLLANHGAVTIGDTLGEAYRRAEYLEWLCEVWLRASARGAPRLLPPDEIDRVAAKLAGYGR